MSKLVEVGEAIWVDPEQVDAITTDGNRVIFRMKEGDPIVIVARYGRFSECLGFAVTHVNKER